MAVQFVKRPGFPREQAASATVAFDPTGLDAFGRLRTAAPFSIFDSKQIFDNQPLFYDDQEVSGSGTSSSHSTNRASTTLSVNGSTAGKRVRQTFQRFNYQPGKSQLIYLTGRMVASGGGEDIVGEIGYGDDNNGIFWRYDEGINKLVIKSYVTGSVVETVVSQANWNRDPLTGSGSSGITLDPTKVQIFFIDFEWLGVGIVRCGFIIDGEYILAHQFNHANSITSVYMSTPNLPIRYSIENKGTGQASSLENICSAVISEGGVDPHVSQFYASTAGTHVDANAVGTIYAIIGIRLKSAHAGQQVEIKNLSIINEQKDDFEWLLILNPTVASTFTYTGLTNSSIEYATGATANTVTGGTTLTGGFVPSDSHSGGITLNLNNVISLGESISGTKDTLVVCARPLTANADIEAGITWQEYA